MSSAAFRVDPLAASTDRPGMIVIWHPASVDAGSTTTGFVENKYFVSTSEAVRLFAAIPTAIIAADPSEDVRALLRDTVRSILDALEGVKGHG
jgi:hypothetical protein